jgi:thiamine-phosphate pyrophosphorylase
MTLDLTPAVLRALASARLWAERLGDFDLAARHVLLALLEEEEGRAAQVLREHGLSIEALRGGLFPQAAWPGERPAFDPHAADPRALMEGLHRLLRRARNVALELAGETTIASEHLLLAILQHDEESRLALEPHGLNLDRLEAEMNPSGPPIALDVPLELDEPTERMDLARILDANANRAREALRVVEEYCRFVLDDAFLTGELKRLRHGLAAALSFLPTHLLLRARDTQGDVGTAITTAAEQQRASTSAVAQANLKRLQEALRALEEYAKLAMPESAAALEQLRYQSYTLEKAILIGGASRERLAAVRLYVLLTAAHCRGSLEWTIQEAAAGGATMFQLREKNLSDRELLVRAAEVCRWVHAAGALFILNDRPDIARLVGADGVHVGQDELPVKEVRRIVGPELLVGVSTHDIGQCRQAILDGADYLGLGPTFASGTKKFETLAGLEYVRQVAAETTLPAFAIGGIDATNVEQVVAAGLRRVAVSRAIGQSERPRAAAAEMVGKLA